MIKCLKLLMIASEIAIVIGILTVLMMFNDGDFSNVAGRLTFMEYCSGFGIVMYFTAKLTKWAIEE